MKTRSESQRGYRYLLPTGLVVGGLIVAGCASPKPDSKAASESPSQSSGSYQQAKIIEKVAGTLDYDGLTGDGLPGIGTCLGGGARPCFAPVRTEPKLGTPESTWLNAGTFDSAGNYTNVAWPYEAGPGRSADILSIACRVSGQEVYGQDSSVRSSVWDAVIVPGEHDRHGITEVGYVPERWVVLASGIAIRNCTQAENPAHAPLVTTPTP